MLNTDVFLNLVNWESFSISGPDATRFLDGQLTNDLKNLGEFEFQLTSRVTRVGMLRFYGYLSRRDKNQYLILAPSEFINDFLEDLQKFIIMDDVELSKERRPVSLMFINNVVPEKCEKIIFLGVPAYLKFECSKNDISEDNYKELNFMFGLPESERFKESNLMVNQTVLIDEAVSNDKGCYVGQETVKKIEINRGAGKKDILILIQGPTSDQIPKMIQIQENEYEVLNSLKIENNLYLKISAKREIRISDMSVNVQLEGREHNANIVLLPQAKSSFEELSQKIFEKSFELFTADKEEEAKNLMEKALLLNRDNPEILESLGALEGRLGNFQRAIELMNELEVADPTSVMAFTNRSLYYMKMGEIEKAEDEKAKATAKSFELLSNQNKQSPEDEKIKKLKRLGMYKEVLEIDPEDEMANMGAAQLYYEFEEFEESIKHIEVLLVSDDSNYKAQFLKAKILMKDTQRSEAKALLDRAILIAGKKGDFLIANEIQSLINSLELPSN